MKKDEITAETGLKENVIDKEVFEREVFLCQKESKEESGGCGWGRCKTCGVVPLLYKLHKGKIIEDEEVSDLKEKLDIG